MVSRSGDASCGRVWPRDQILTYNNAFSSPLASYYGSAPAANSTSGAPSERVEDASWGAAPVYCASQRGTGADNPKHHENLLSSSRSRAVRARPHATLGRVPSHASRHAATAAPPLLSRTEDGGLCACMRHTCASRTLYAARAHG
jgi:hypothetical protein